ncbi:MAG: metal ABC transporter permease [Nitriliruptoraceae bacterium]
MRSAFAAGVLTVVASSLVGTWVVMRGMAFMTDALAHGVLPGIALAYILGGNLLLGGALSAVVMILGVSLASARSRLGEDTSIGLLFVGMLAAGVAIMSRGGAYAGDLTGILFGDPLGVTRADLRIAAWAALAALAIIVLFHRPFLVLTFSPQKAALLGMRPRLTHLVMLGLVAMVVLTSFRTVGTLLVFAFMIAPPATAALVSRRVPVMMAVSVGVGVAGVGLGLVVSFHASTATAPTIAGLTVLAFFTVLAGTELTGRLRARSRAKQGAEASGSGAAATRADELDTM